MALFPGGIMSEEHYDERDTTPNNDGISRRDALKALAALGAAGTLLSMPTKWETPVLQVGAISAVAQTCSPVCSQPSTITDLVVSERLAGCSPISGENGDLFSLSFLFNDAPECGGLIPERDRIRVRSVFQPSGFTTDDEVVLAAVNIAGSNGGFLSGRVTVPICIAFATDISVSLTVSLVNGSCQAGNQLSATVNNPGASTSSRQGVRINP